MKNLKRAGWIIGYGNKYSQLLHLYNNNSSELSKVNASLLKEKKVKIPLSGFSNLPAEPTSEEISSGSVDWDAQEKNLKSAMTSNASAASGMLDMGQKARTVDALVTPEMVYLAHPATGEWLPLNEDEQPKPRFPQDTWPVTSVQSLISKFSGAPTAEGEVGEEDGEVSSNGKSSSIATANGNGSDSSKKRKGGGKKR